MLQAELFRREEGEQALQIATGLKRDRSALFFEHLKRLGMACSEGSTDESFVALKLGRCMGFMEGAGLEGLMALLSAVGIGDKDISKGASLVLVKLTPELQEETVPHLARLYDCGEDGVAAISRRGEGELGEQRKQALLNSAQVMKAGAITCLKALGDVAVRILSEDPANAPLLEELKG